MFVSCASAVSAAGDGLCERRLFDSENYNDTDGKRGLLTEAEQIANLIKFPPYIKLS